MKKEIFTLGALVLGGCLAAAAQTGTQSSAAEAGKTQTTTVQGCLSQSPDGAFLLADNAGDLFLLSGDASQLTTYVGKMVRVHGIAMNSSASGADAMAGDTADASTGVAQQFHVSSAQKVADTCVVSK